MSRAYLSIGSNLGDREAYLRSVIAAIEATNHTQVEAVSSLYQTDPYGPVEQDDFLNAALRIETELAPLDLLDFTQSIEQAAHRERLVHWGPRTLDVDIVYYQGVELDTERLTLPHKEAHRRLFVLVPLAEVWQEGRPKGQPLESWINSLADQQVITKYKEGWYN